MTSSDDLLIKVDRLQALLVLRATGGEPDQREYEALRKELIQNPQSGPHLPRFVRSYHTIPEFWAFIQPKFKGYRERKNFIADAFLQLYDKLEAVGSSPSDTASSHVLSAVDSEHVQEAWGRMLERRLSDPQGAITMARTLLETVCKFILGELAVSFDEAADLPKLYKMVAEKLGLAPSQHSEAIIKQILGGCCAVVEGLGAFRNRVGDAHGKSKHAGRASPRHAALAVNLAGSMASFLIESWEASVGH